MLRSRVDEPLPELDRQVFRQVVPLDHYLCRVAERVDFERFRPRLAAAYSSGMGRPALDPVFMLKVLFLRFHYKLSDRQVMERTRTDLAFRWFLGLGLEASVPHHTEGTYFRRRIGAEQFTRIFQDLVGLAREHGLVSDRLRLKDATHLIADAAELTPLALAAQVRERVLRAADPLWPDWARGQRDQVETLRQTTAELPDGERLAARVEQLRAMAAEARERLATLPAGTDAARQRLEQALTVAAKLLADRDDPDAGDRLGSAADPDARVGKHGGYFLGYLLDLAIDADSELITAVQVLPGNGAEAADTAALIRQEESAQGNDVRGVSLDGAGYNGPVLRELTDPKGLNLEVTVPPPKTPPRATFGPDRFALTVLEDGQRGLKCPQGETTRRHARTEKKTGDRFVFAAGTCAACPRRADCLEDPGRPGGRTVVKNDYEAEYRRVEEKAATPEYEATRREHPKVERRLGDMARHHNCRRACFRGLAKTLVQTLLTAMVVNVKRMVKLLDAAAHAAIPPPPRADGVAA